MKKVILEEIKNMKYLLGYKSGVVISEQQTPQLGTIQPSNQSTDDMFKNAQAAAAGLTNTNNQPQTPSPAAATGAPAASTTTSAPDASTTTPAPAVSTPVTPIKIGVEYPLIKELQNTLINKFQSVLTPDGKYSPETAASVLAVLQKLSVNSTETKTPDTTVDPSKAASETAKVAQTGGNTNGTAAGTTAGSGVVSVNANDFIAQPTS